MNSRILIKIGGRAFDGEEGFRELAQGIKGTPGTEVIIVHGGGAEISQALKAAGRETVFVDGMRVTQAADVKIVESVLSGIINERIAGLAFQKRRRLPAHVRQDPGASARRAHADPRRPGAWGMSARSLR